MLETVTRWPQSPPTLQSLLLGRLVEGLVVPEGGNFARFRDDPAGFGQHFFGESYTEDMIKVMESVRDNPVTIARSANAVGKTHGAARIAAWFYKVFEDSKVFTAAAPPESNLRTLLWGEIDGLVRQFPHVFADDKIKIMRIEQHSEWFVDGITIPAAGNAEEREARFSGKHAPFLLFIVDEGDAVPAACYKGIESCMSGGHARLLIMLNPRARRGPVYNKEKAHEGRVVELSAFRHPNVIEGRDVYPGAVTRETTVRRLNMWSDPVPLGKVLPADAFEVPAFLVGTTAKRQDGTEYPPLASGWRVPTEPAMCYMVLGTYPAQGENQLISEAWTTAARSRWDAYVAKFGENPPMGTKPVQGLDVAEMGTDENASCLRYGGWVARIATWSGLDIIQTGDKAAQRHNVYNATMTLVDGTGIGAGVAPYMQRPPHRCPALGVKVAWSPTMTSEMGEFAQLRDQLWWAVREWLRADPGAMLPPDQHLIDDLLTPTYAIKKGKIKIMEKSTMRELLGRSPDRGDALGLTFAPQERGAKGFML